MRSLVTSSGSAESAAATSVERRRRRIATGWLAECRWPISPAVVIAGTKHTAVVIGVGRTVEGVVHLSALTADTRIVVGCSRHSRAVETAIGAVGAADVMREPVLISDRVEGTKVGVDGGRRRVTDDENRAAIIRIVEIGIIPAVPEEITVPRHVGVSKAKPIAKTMTIAITHPVSKPIRRITIAYHGAGRCAIVGIIGAVIIEIRPAGGILGFHADIIVAGSCAVIFALPGGGGGGCLPAAGRIVNIIGCLSMAGGGATTHPKGYGNGQQGIYLFHGIIIY